MQPKQNTSQILSVHESNLYDAPSNSLLKGFPDPGQEENSYSPTVC